jgi:hypothetical protein
LGLARWSRIEEPAVEATRLEELDAQGLEVLQAITRSLVPPVGSHASPHGFVCSDGRTYWVKRNAQRGLVAELVAGRLGAAVEAAPSAVVVNLTSAAAPADGSTNHLIGVGVGIQDVAGAENFRHVTQLRPDGTLDPTKLDVASRVRVLTFQTWLGVGDTQILVNLSTGRLLSIDHGEWCPDPRARSEPDLVPTPGVPADFGRTRTLVDDALGRIAALDDEDLLAAVARVPDGPEWNSDRAHRLALAEWLAFRRDRLGEVIHRWRSS